MLFRSIVSEVKDSFGRLMRRSFDVRIFIGKPHGSVHQQLHEQSEVVQNSRWANNLPPELLLDVMKRLEESESTWPARKYVVACTAFCRSRRIVMCKEIVRSPEFCGKLTFPVSLKHLGSRDGTIQCFVKRDKANLTYHLFLCLTPVLLVENGKFLFSANRNRRATHTEYTIFMDADNISRSNSAYIGKLRSNFLGTKFIIYDTQPPQACTHIPSLSSGRSSRGFLSEKVSPTDSYNIAQVTYELNVLGRGPCKMNCIMHSIPVSALEVGGSVPGQPELMPRYLEDPVRSIPFSKSLDCSNDFSSSQKVQAAGSEEQASLVVPPPPELDKIIMPFDKVGKDMFTMDYTYLLSAFQTFAIRLSSFDTKLTCE
uniref:Tubby C-terminal domain-containing protein n=1 Tax=Kalanchoe fedtschenkoi TaxID=63787 RepID=A0A7N0R8Z0_KALFE